MLARRSTPLLLLALALLGTLSVATPAAVVTAQSACYTLTLYAHPYGYILASPAPNCGGNSYTANTVVSLQARYASCMTFAGWTGDASGTSSSTSIVMDRPKAVGMTLTRIGSWC